MTKSTIDNREIAKFASLSEHWWNKHGALRTLHDINPARLDFISRYAALAGKRVLDVGCGGGILTEAMASTGAIATGIDAESEAIAVADRHAQSVGITIDYSCTPIEDYEAAPYPVITCMEMLEHVACPQEVINHCARLLQKDGYLFLSTINRSFQAYVSVIVAAEYVMNLLPRQTHDYNKFIKPAELARMVRAAGLEVIGMQGISYNPFTHTASLQDSVAVNYLLACRKG
ncbi:bifunctional 2-polyprenyl-6-hydroxyphenol methylase/3-demethylubiquinol 3-O-methyltransferase UbiG [Legionella dresdenensis]|uniref:Ubiquinone biosynthesis O-methyltransferase n=1 Tax=Legionella dresdenensis TaxID=450200 RepID=A0ABV8CGI5_9GAMM